MRIPPENEPQLWLSLGEIELAARAGISRGVPNEDDTAAAYAKIAIGVGAAYGFVLELAHGNEPVIECIRSGAELGRALAQKGKAGVAKPPDGGAP